MISKALNLTKGISFGLQRRKFQLKKNGGSILIQKTRKNQISYYPNLKETLDSNSVGIKIHLARKNLQRKKVVVIEKGLLLYHSQIIC